MCSVVLKSIIILVVLFHSTHGYRFLRSVQAIGFPYYKILMALGTCRSRILFSEQKLWAKIKLNRVFDIYYKSSNDNIKVSRVEISLVTNDTSSMVHSDHGVGWSDFSATMYLPSHIGFVFYSLTIFTCSPLRSDDDEHTMDQVEPVTYLPFYRRSQINE